MQVHVPVEEECPHIFRGCFPPLHQLNPNFQSIQEYAPDAIPGLFLWEDLIAVRFSMFKGSIGSKALGQIRSSEPRS